MAGVSSPSTEVYDPKTFFPHAALLRQAFAHCAIFPTAASRRSLDRVSVPVWPITLSGRLTIVALVGRYPTNKLMVRELILRRQLSRRGHPFTPGPCDPVVLSGISIPFEMLSRFRGQITHVLLTRSPLYSPPEGSFLARLACVRHAASVRSEPGSNSPVDTASLLARTDLNFGPSGYCSKEPVGLRCTLFRCQRAIDRQETLRSSLPSTVLSRGNSHTKDRAISPAR